ncbi:MAG TPA: universal stress protein [Vicinamibacterales bacterium]|jgi:nucleotide-binding universal stress UspA family protein
MASTVTSPKTVLVPTDFEDCSRAALDYARTLAAACDSTIHLLHVVTEPLREPWIPYLPGGAFLDLLESMQRDALRRLRLIAPLAADAARPMVLVTVWGDPAEEIVKYAHAHQADLIVCGTHGRRGLERLAMGSVAERLVRVAPCPVLTVHADQSRAA